VADNEEQLKAVLSAFLEARSSTLDERTDANVDNPEQKQPSLSASPARNYEAEAKAIANDHDRLRNEALEEDNRLKRRYGNGLLIALAVQLLIMNLVFAAVGFGWLDYKDWALHLYVSGTLAEIFALVLVVTKYLFPKHE